MVSCNKNENTLFLKDKIKKLEAENSKLKKSQGKLNKLTSCQILLDPHTLKFKSNTKNIISGYIYQEQEFPMYDLYLADEKYNFKESDKILADQKKSTFEFEYQPKGIKHEIVRVVAVFKLDTVQLNLTGRTDRPGEK